MTDNTNALPQYRVDSGSVFEYSPEHHGYMFLGSLMGRSLDEFLADIEQLDQDA